MAGLEAVLLQLDSDGPQGQPLAPERTSVGSHGAHVVNRALLRCLCAPALRLRSEVLRLAQLEPPGLAGCQRRFRPRGDQLRFPLGDGGHHMDGEVVSLRHIDGHKADAGFHEAGDDGHVAGQAVELGNEEDTPETAGLVEGRFELGSPALPGSGFDFGDLGDQLQTLAPGVGQDGGLLGFEAEAALTLLLGGDAVVGDSGGSHRTMLQGSSERSRIVTMLPKPLLLEK